MLTTHMQASQLHAVWQRRSVRQGVLDWHTAAAEEFKRRKEEAQRQRLAALRSSDMEVSGKDRCRRIKCTFRGTFPFVFLCM